MPAKSLTWYWQLQGTVNNSQPVAAYDIDGFDNSAGEVSTLHGQGKHVICYIDVGTAENWRPDYSSFPASVLNADGSPEGGRIAEFSGTGTLITKFGSTGSSEGKIGISSFGLAISGGHLYLAEYGNQRVQELSTTGEYRGSFDPAGSGTGKSDEPYGIATDPSSGNLYVSELGNDRVQEFSPAGAFITTFGSVGSGPGQLQSPRGVAVSTSGQIFIADTGNDRLEEWAP